MIDIRVSLDSVGYTSKPPDSEVGKISNRIGGAVQVLNCPASYYEFVQKVGGQGYTFSPATFENGVRAQNNFQQMQLLVLDFDGAVSHKDIRDRAIKYKLPILFTYDTFSSEEGNERFRVVFLNDAPIEDKRGAKILKNALMTIFPETDKTDTDISKMYYGGKSCRYYNPEHRTVTPESIIIGMNNYLYETRGPTHHKKYLKSFADKHGIRLNESGLLDTSNTGNQTKGVGKSSDGKNSPNSIIFSKGNGEILPNATNNYFQIHLRDECTNISVEKRQPKNHSEYMSSTIKDFHRYCRLFREFESG